MDYKDSPINGLVVASAVWLIHSKAGSLRVRILSGKYGNSHHSGSGSNHSATYITKHCHISLNYTSSKPETCMNPFILKVGFCN